MNLNKIFVADTLFAILIDFAILVIPAVSTIPLRVSLFRKLKVIGLLGAGNVAVGVAITGSASSSNTPTRRTTPRTWPRSFSTGEQKTTTPCPAHYKPFS